ncbi:MAG: efflux RND transporter periplasmic adaptor subunit [Gallionella sp.]|nr:efflux RND transporter periplasmic adaptor subunit [Gallionella sp.]
MTTRLFVLLSFLLAQSAWAGEEILFSAQQIKTLGISSALLPEKKSGEVSGLPAQIVVPGNQLFVVSTPLPALLEQSLVGVGDHVNKGQIIAYLQSPALAEGQRGLLQANVQHQLAQENLSRDLSLWKDGIIAESRYRSTRGAALEAQANLAERKQMLRLSGMSDGAIRQLQSGHALSASMTITSPITGVVLEKFAGAGQRLDAAMPLYKIAKLHPLALEIQAPLSAVGELKVGAPIEIPAFHAKGKLIAIGRSLTGSNQSILLRGMITEGTDNLRPNQFVEASIGTTVVGAAQWEIPNSALARVGGATLVFITTPKGFLPHAVTVLNEGAQNTVITGDLKGNERIAVHGVSALKSKVMGLGGGE